MALDLTFLRRTRRNAGRNVKSATLDHDDFGLNQPKIMNVIDSNKLEHDVVRKPLRTFRHHALESDSASLNQTRRLFFCLGMIPRVEPEGMLVRKPVSTPDQVRGRLFRDML